MKRLMNFVATAVLLSCSAACAQPADEPVDKPSEGGQQEEKPLEEGQIKLSVSLNLPGIVGESGAEDVVLSWDGTESVGVIFSKNGETRTKYVPRLASSKTQPGVFSGTIDLGNYSVNDIIGFVYPYNPAQSCGEYYSSKSEYRIAFYTGCDNSQSNDSGAEIVEQHQNVPGELNKENVMMISAAAVSESNLVEDTYMIRGGTMQPVFCNVRLDLYGKHADGSSDEKIKKVSISTLEAPHVAGRYNWAVDKEAGQLTGKLVINAKQYPVTTVLDTPSKFGSGEGSPTSVYVSSGARYRDGSDDSIAPVNKLVVTIETDKAEYTKTLTNAGLKFIYGHILPISLDISSFDRTPLEGGESSLPTKVDDGYLRILAVGNSWSKCAIRHITDIAALAGRKVIVGHGYLGGSGLEDQYYGIDNLSYSFNHDGVNEIVHSAYQYWKYTSDGSTSSYVRDPADDTAYGNGKKGIGVTLESVVTDEPWDVMIFQPSASLGYSNKVNTWQAEDGNRSKFSLLNLVNRIKEMMDPSVSSTIKTGVMVPWSYPSDNKARISSIANRYSGRISGYTGSQEDWNLMFEYLHEDLQNFSKTLNDHIHGTYLVNVGLAIYNARQHSEMLRFGYNMQVDKSDTHLADGMSKYVASLMYCYEILGLTDKDIVYSTSSAPTRSDAAKSTTEYADYNNAIVNTLEDKALAVRVSWNAQKGVTESGAPAITSVTTSTATYVTENSAMLNGSFSFIGTTKPTAFTCGFEYKEAGAAEWTVVTCTPTSTPFSWNLTGLTKDKEYLFRAWAKSGSDIVYGKELNFLTSDRLILTPSAEDFKGFPSAQAYSTSEPDEVKTGTYTYTKDDKDYEFYFYGKKQLFSNKYNLYYGTGSGQHIMFGAGGSYVLLPAVPGKKLVSVTIKIYKATKLWSITTRDGVDVANTNGAPAGGENHSFGSDGEQYTFNLSGTENNTSYALRSGNSNSGIKMVEIVYQ